MQAITNAFAIYALHGGLCGYVADTYTHTHTGTYTTTQNSTGDIGKSHRGHDKAGVVGWQATI